MIYILLMAATWLVNGSIKFAVNFLIHGKKAKQLIGYGGFPSTHTAIVCAPLGYICLEQGWNHPAVGVLLVVLWIVANDARSLRRQVGKHAEYLNKLSHQTPKLRERMGHNIKEIAGGAVVGLAIGAIVTKFDYLIIQ